MAVKLLTLTCLVVFLLAEFTSGQMVIEPEWQAAYDALYNGDKKWPVWMVGDNQITVDGAIDETAWDTAQKVYVTGEWFYNQGYLTNPDGWTGFDDLVSEVRTLYDSEKFYMSFMHYDDIHSEGDGLEGWYQNDGVEIMMQPAGHNASMYLFGGVCSILPGHEFAFRITQRFTETVGMHYYDGDGCVRCPADTLWDPPCDEPWDGIQCVAKAVTDPGILDNWYATWCMECEFPFTHENFSTAFTDKGYSTPPAPGSDIRLSFHINDDDADIEGFDGQGGQYIFRRDCAWWGSVDCARHGHWSDAQFYPFWMYAGSKSDSANKAAADAVFPDTNYVYCGLPPSFYKNCVETGDCAAGILPYSRARGTGSVLVASNSPNPFKPYTVISYRAPDIHAEFSVRIYDSKGNLVRDLVDAKARAGHVFWRGLNDRGLPVPSGVYVYRITNGSQVFSSKMVLAR